VIDCYFLSSVCRFEKLFAGLYLGEIVRLVLSDLVSKDLLFADLDESKVEWVHWKGSFTTGHVSKVERSVFQFF